MFRVAILIAAMLLSGCSQYYAQKDHKECASYGLNAGTTQYGQCRVALQTNRENRRARAMNAYYQQQILMQSQQTKPVHCYTYGNTMSCY